MRYLLALVAALFLAVPAQATNPVQVLGEDTTSALPREIETTDRALAVGAVTKEATILASAARTATTNSADQTNYHHKGVVIMIDMTAVPGVDTVTFNVQGKDPVSGTYYTILASTAIVATGFTVLTVYPGVADSANSSSDDALPRTWRINAVHSAGTSFTYSIGASLVP